jgi:hypothetical protein
MNVLARGLLRRQYDYGQLIAEPMVQAILVARAGCMSGVNHSNKFASSHNLTDQFNQRYSEPRK